MPHLHTELHQGVLRLTIDRPKANAFNLALILELQTAFRQALRDSQTRVVILTGTGKVFGAGQDIEEMRGGGESMSYRQHLLETYNPLILQIRQLEKPVIAAVNGVCAGASLGIALACDLRLASEDARFVVGFNGIGLIPDSGVGLLLPALIGLGRASEFTLSNAPIPAEQALAWGLVNHVYPAETLQSAATLLAERFTGSALGAFGLSKRLFNKTMLPNLAEALEYESQLQEAASHLPEHKEGVSAFLEKRPPVFFQA